MKKISTLVLMATIVTLGSCARQYPVFNQMPTNAYIDTRTKAAEKPVVVAAQEKAVPEATPTLESLTTDPQVSQFLAQNNPRQIDEQLERALATTQGKELMAKPLIAAQITKARAMIAKNELRNAPGSEVQTSRASKMVNTTLKNHVEKSSTLAPASSEAAKQLNQKIKIGLILIGVSILVSLIPGVWYLAGVIGVVGVVFVVLGLLEM